MDQNPRLGWKWCVWSDFDCKTVQKAVIANAAMVVIEGKREEKVKLHAAMEKELTIFLCQDNSDFMLPDGLTYL